MSRRVSTHLWFDNQAKEAAALYTSTFAGSRIKSTTTLHGTPSGAVDIVTIELPDQEFTLLSAGPLFKFNESISFLISCKTKDEVDAIWGRLSEGGKTLMELGEYSYSERFGWLQDRYGLSWQVMFMGEHEITQKITPTFMFTEQHCGQAEEAMRFYASIFPESHVGVIHRYGDGDNPDKEGTVMHASFKLDGQEFAAMDSGREHGFTFNEAISFMVHCENQQQIDHYWDALSADPRAEQCGWLKDKFGVSWQIVPTVMDKMLADKDETKIARVTRAFLKMKKFDIATLERAYEGT